MTAIPLGAVSGGFGFWFIALAVTTLSATLAGLAKGGMLTVTPGTLTAGAALTAIGFWAGSLGWTRAGGWLFVVSAAAAWLLATGMMLEQSSAGRSSRSASTTPTPTSPAACRPPD